MANITKTILTVSIYFLLLQEFQCASSESNSNEDDTNSTRIIGGKDAKEGQFPYYASVHRNIDHFTCGGSIIDRYWILTAAHCKKGENSLRYARVGSIYKYEGGVVHKISMSITHPDYDPDTVEGDICLLKTTKQIVYNDFVKPIPLANFNTTSGLLMKIAGLGLTGYSPDGADTTYASVLQYISMTTITDTKCMKSYGSYITSTVFCAYRGFEKGVCYGDSGGGLVYNNYLHGISAFMKACAIGRPDGFTRVYSYRTWIADTMAAN